MSTDKFFDNYLAWLRATVSIFPAVPIASFLCVFSFAHLPQYEWLRAFLIASLIACPVMSWRVLKAPIKRFGDWLQPQCDRCAQALDGLSSKQLMWLVIVSTALALFLELALIRWQASLWQVFGFFKNFVLLACFAGLGTGYACSKERPLLPAVPFCAALAICFFLALRFLWPESAQFGLHFSPITEEATMGTLRAFQVTNFISLYCLLLFSLCATGLIFLPIGQLCGAGMSRLPQLKGYSANLVGSLIGVLLMMALSNVWAPPVVWFGIGLWAIVALLHNFGAFRFACGSVVFLTLVCLALGKPLFEEYIYSPYQMLAVQKGEHGLSMKIEAAGSYYQHIIDMSEQAQSDPYIKRTAAYYGLPYMFKPNPGRVLIMGSGTGNDVAAALRAGAKSVDAVEIDPAIYKLGLQYHPESPYQDPRVHITIGDARQFLRSTKNRYDLVVFGLLDSHVSTSQASHLRTDSYVYTVDSMKEVRRCLAEDGVICLSFSRLSHELDYKLQSMIAAAFGSMPVTLHHEYDGNLTMLHARDGQVVVPPQINDLIANRTLELLQPNTGLGLSVDLSTDDWPFFYLAKKQMPWSYLPMFGLLLAITALMLKTLAPTEENLSGSSFRQNFPFFLLGTGFMLIETKAITELGLYFGNTWLVTAQVLTAIMIMAFVANMIVDKVKPKAVWWSGALLIIAIAGGMALHHSGAAASLPAWAATALVTLPLAFSGVVFSTLFSRATNVSSAMCYNILGALAGGGLEYLALWLGYEALYGVSIAVYLCALLATRVPGGAIAAAVKPEMQD